MLQVRLCVKDAAACRSWSIDKEVTNISHQAIHRSCGEDEEYVP